MTSIRRIPLLAAFAALLMLLTIAARPTSAQVPITDVKHVPGQTSISGDGRIAATNWYSRDPENPHGVTVRDVESGAVLVSLGLPPGTPSGPDASPHRFVGAPLLDHDGSTIVTVFCDWNIGSGAAGCRYWRVNVEEQSLDLLIDHDEFPPDLPARPFTLTSDGSALYFSTGPVYRYDLASGEFDKITVADTICTDDAAVPYESRACEIKVIGDGAWLLVSTMDIDPGGVIKRSQGWVVNTETEDADRIFEVLAPGGGRLVDGSADGSRVVYQYSETSTEGGGLYLWERDDPGAKRERIDLLPDGSVPPHPTGPFFCGVGDNTPDDFLRRDDRQMTPDGRYLAYLARPESDAYQSVFIVDLDTGDIRLASPTNDDSALNGCVVKLQIADDGKTVTYVSAATNIDSEGVPLPVYEDGDPPPVSFISRLLEAPAPPRYRAILPGTARTAAN